jgi:hypothetical protein
MRATVIAIAVVLGCDGSSSALDGDAGGRAADARADSSEICDNGLDEDGDTRIDEDCSCRVSNIQPCHPGSPAEAGVGACALGVQTCELADGAGRWSDCEGAVTASPELCDGSDNDCNGSVDDGSEPCEVEVMLPGNDCATVTCPATHPYPIACNDLTFPPPGDNRGCVASEPARPSVFFKSGDGCSSGAPLTGAVVCGVAPGAPLDAASCPFDKPTKIYVATPAQCPD